MEWSKGFQQRLRSRHDLPDLPNPRSENPGEDLRPAARRKAVVLPRGNFAQREFCPMRDLPKGTSIFDTLPICQAQAQAIRR